jgi:hypothetical protein
MKIVETLAAKTRRYSVRRTCGGGFAKENEVRTD